MRAPFIDILEEDTRNLSMLRLFKVICLVCFLLVPLTAFTVEEEAFEDIDYFPADYKCYDTVFNFAAALHWISEEWKKNVPYEIGYPLLYSILIALPLLPFLCFMIPTRESLQLQLENERKRQQENEHEQNKVGDEPESDEEDDEEFYVPEFEPRSNTRSGEFIRSKSVNSIGERLAGIKVNKPELRTSRVALETSDEREQGGVIVLEQSPDLRTIDTADSFTRLKKLGARICPESTVGKACVAVVSGVLISYGIYRLFSK